MSEVPTSPRVPGKSIFPSLSIAFVSSNADFIRGRLVKDRSTGQPKLNCRNWECGVLVPVTAPGGRKYSLASNDTTATLDTTSSTELPAQQLPARIFQGTVPVPMKIPGADLTENRPPWFFQG